MLKLNNFISIFTKKLDKFIYIKKPTKIQFDFCGFHGGSKILPLKLHLILNIL